MDWLFLFGKIMLINLVLSGDNAVVIGMASKNLPPHQRRQAVWWGAFGAVALRLALTFAAVALFAVPYIQAVDTLLLAWIAVKLLSDDKSHASGIREASSLAAAVRTIVAADFVMSLDNVLAIAAAAKGDTAVLILGIALNIPLIDWGSGLVARLLDRYPALMAAGAGILAYTAGEMFVSDPCIDDWVLHGGHHRTIPFAAALAAVACGLLLRLRKAPCK